MTVTRPAIREATKQRTVNTTTLLIERPHDYGQLEQRFRVIRYILPSDLLYRKNPNDFGHVHNALRDQLDVPYKSFQHDRLDGSRRWAVYALYPHDQDIVEVQLPWYGGAKLAYREVAFADMPFHVLIKLLQVSLFRGEHSTRFVGRDTCYTYARAAGGDYHYCVKVELQGAPTTLETDPVQEFRIIPHAKRFARATHQVPSSEPRYGKRAVGDRFYFLQLRSREVELEQSIYREMTSADRRAHVKYHDPRDLDASRGKIVADFIREFREYLLRLGITADVRQRTFSSVSLPPNLELDTARLGVVGVHDNRIARDNCPLSAYMDLFAGIHPDIMFVELEEPLAAPTGGMLVLLDAEAADFADDGPLSGQIDPYHSLYARTPEIPKQSLNVNTNDANQLEGGDYLRYSMLQPEDDDFKLRLDVALSELFLKCAIIHGVDRFPIPLALTRHAFVRRQRYDGGQFTTALCIENGGLQFADLGDPDQRAAFVALVGQWGVDWDARFEDLLSARGGSTDVPRYDIIVGQDLFASIEDLEERILYDYDEMERRHQEQKIAHPIHEFKLAPHYDQVRHSAMLPFAPLEAPSDIGRDGSGREHLSKQVVHSRGYLRQLLEYDRLLDEIAITRPTISLLELTSGVWMERIARIFGAKEYGDGKYYRRLILGKYQKRGLFRSVRGNDVHLYQGIWLDETGAFVVGSPTSMNIHGQRNAHLVRRFQVFQGTEHFQPGSYLAAMGVQFVRHGQYTVSPYYYHLIDLFVRNVGRYVSS